MNLRVDRVSWCLQLRLLIHVDRAAVLIAVGVTVEAICERIVTLICCGESHVTKKVDLFLGVAGIHLNRFKLVLAHDGLTNVNSIHVTSVADVTEAKV